jgi:hypothetical protein
VNNEPIRRTHKDSSREKSLYFLLQATARQLTETKQDRDVIRDLLPQLTVTGIDDYWSISFLGYDEKTTVVLKSNFDFYRHTDNPNVGQNNRAEAVKVLITLIPELRMRTHLETMKKQKKIASQLYSLKYLIPTLLVASVILTSRDSHLFRSSLIAAAPIIFYEIKNVLLQIGLSVVGSAIGYLLHGMSTDPVFAAITAMMLLDALLSIAVLKNRANERIWYISKLGILIRLGTCLQWNYVNCGLLLLGVFFGVFQMIAKPKVSKSLELLLLIIGSFCLPILLFTCTPWRTSIVRLLILTPVCLMLILRNRANGLTRYLIVNSVLLLL